MTEEETVNQDTKKEALKKPEVTKHQLIKLVVEVGPLVAFFITNARVNIFAATGVFMAATVVALIVSYRMDGKVPTLPLVSGFFVLTFGALTLYLQDDLFIKLKPTIVNSLFAVILLGGLLFQRPLLKPVMASVLELDDKGWRLLTLRWGLFFIGLALLNEVMWRNFSTDTWVNFKVFGIMPLTVIFSLAQVPLIQRHSLPVSTNTPLP